LRIVSDASVVSVFSIVISLSSRGAGGDFHLAANGEGGEERRIIMRENSKYGRGARRAPNAD